MLSPRKQYFFIPRRTSSTLRRHLKINRFLSSDLIVMRAYSFYRIHNFFCVIAPESPHCERYFRSYLKCKLAPLAPKPQRLLKKKQRLTSEIITIYTKTSRLRKQYRAVIKKIARFR
jgi:hypothetical protein